MRTDYLMSSSKPKILDYYLGKLAQINYRIATHPESANTRLASQAYQILVIAPLQVPAKYKREFTSLIKLVDESCIDAQKLGKGLQPYKLNGIRNSNAAKYIKLLIDIEYDLERLRET